MTWRSRAGSSAGTLRPALSPARSIRPWPVIVVFFLLAVCACEVATEDGLRDQVGVPLPAGPVRRVVALAPDVTEIVFALSAAERLVAVPRTANYPEQARHLPHVDPGSVESILAHRPDLVLATTAGNDPRIVGRLSALGVRTFTVDPTSLRRVAESFLLVSNALGVPTSGRKLEQEFSSRVARARERAAALPPGTGLYIVWWQPLMVAGPGTFHHDLLAAAGLANLAPAGGGRYPRINPELLLDPRLDTIVVPDEEDLRTGFAQMAREAIGRRLNSGTVAVLWLAADPASRPGPRVVEALEQLVEMRSLAAPSEYKDPGAPAPTTTRTPRRGNPP